MTATQTKPTPAAAVEFKRATVDADLLFQELPESVPLKSIKLGTQTVYVRAPAVHEIRRATRLVMDDDRIKDKDAAVNIYLTVAAVCDAGQLPVFNLERDYPRLLKMPAAAISPLFLLVHEQCGISTDDADADLEAAVKK